jgi:hypothetical protein
VKLKLRSTDTEAEVKRNCRLNKEVQQLRSRETVDEVKRY